MNMRRGSLPIMLRMFSPRPRTSSRSKTFLANFNSKALCRITSRFSTCKCSHPWMVMKIISRTLSHYPLTSIPSQIIIWISNTTFSTTTNKLKICRRSNKALRITNLWMTMVMWPMLRISSSNCSLSRCKPTAISLRKRSSRSAVIVMTLIIQMRCRWRDSKSCST